MCVREAHAKKGPDVMSVGLFLWVWERECGQGLGCINLLILHQKRLCKWVWGRVLEDIFGVGKWGLMLL